ncbi:hypothetical protein ACFW04_008414 [Cataglyphis niger]
MAVRREARYNLNPEKSSKRSNKGLTENCLKLWRQLASLLTDPKKLSLITKFFILAEIIVNILVIENVSYTEIDWRAYMQEVEGFLNGTMDYSKLRGDTGPLTAQYIYAIVYAITLMLVFKIYSRTKKVPPYVLILMCCTSYRIHSIFVLRLFNDPIAMLLLYASFNAFLDNRWYLGSVLFSLAVSVKMNILLFAPALLVAYLCVLGLFKTLIHLNICAFIQLILGLPFLLENPIAYIKGAFNLGRIFEFKWTVNWRFLSEQVFVHPYFHNFLLFLHVLTLLYCLRIWIVYMESYAKLKDVEKNLKPQILKKEKIDMSIVSQLLVYPLFLANFIGIMFSRSLHYQFYVWYYHTLPYIAWCTDYKTVIKLTLLGVIELCWNTYPSTVFSSAALHICHIILLYGTLKTKSDKTIEK